MKRRILILALALTLVFSLCACGQSPKADFAATESIAEPQMSFGAERPMAEQSTNTVADAAPAEKNAATGGTEDGAAPAPLQEKIIYTVNLTMETTKFDETRSSFEAAVEVCGGYTMYSEVSGNSRYEEDGTARLVNRSASYTVCVPAEKLDAFLSEASSFGNVTSNNKSAENVTTRYTDFETRKASLLAEEGRLLELLEKAENVEALIALQNRLSEVRYEVETIQSNLNDLDRRIAYSTVCLYLQEVRGYRASLSVTQSFGERLRDAFGNGWDNFIEGLEDFAIGLAEAIIPLTLFAAVVVVLVLLVRRKIKKNRAKRAEQAAAPEEK